MLTGYCNIIAPANGPSIFTSWYANVQLMPDQRANWRWEHGALKPLNDHVLFSALPAPYCPCLPLLPFSLPHSHSPFCCGVLSRLAVWLSGNRSKSVEREQNMHASQFATLAKRKHATRATTTTAAAAILATTTTTTISNSNNNNYRE